MKIFLLIGLSVISLASGGPFGPPGVGGPGRGPPGGGPPGGGPCTDGAPPSCDGSPPACPDDSAPDFSSFPPCTFTGGPPAFLLSLLMDPSSPPDPSLLMDVLCPEGVKLTCADGSTPRGPPPGLLDIFQGLGGRK
jgi:hypothetical protein